MIVQRLALLTALEAAALLLVGFWPDYRWSFSIVHLVCAIAAMALVRRMGLTAPQPGISHLWVAAAGGPAAMLLSAAVLPVLRRRTRILQIVGAVRAEPATATTTTLKHILDQRVLYPDAARIGPLATVFRYGAIADRQAAIEAVVSGFEPQLSSGIAHALTDSDQTIRALAASASAQIVQQFARRRAELEERAANDDTPQARVALAEMLAAHGRHNILLSEAQRERVRGEAAALLNHVLLGLRADDPERFELSALLYALHRHDPSTIAAPSVTSLPLAEACDALFRARDFAGLARRCSLADLKTLKADDLLHETIAFWRQ